MSEQFDGKIDIIALGNTSNVRITLDGDKAYIISGDKGQDSDLFLSKWFGKKKDQHFSGEPNIPKPRGGCHLPYDNATIQGLDEIGKNPTQNKRLPITLNGKVYCEVDIQYMFIWHANLRRSGGCYA